MALFQMNPDLTYTASPLVENNKFLNMPAEDNEPPKYE